MNIVTSGYQFIPIHSPTMWRLRLKKVLQALSLKGTVLLSPEGINIMMAGSRYSMDFFYNYLREFSPFINIHFKENISDRIPYTRLLVKVKKEIIAFDQPHIDPHKHTSPHMSPTSLKEKLDNQEELILLDTRNDYEWKLGTFKNAITFSDFKHFRTFPDKVKDLPDSIKNTPVVTFCTGGVRCEKAAPYLETLGFTKVYQLDGGILNYFEKCGNSHWQGECFVFDKRVCVDTKGSETPTVMCYKCRNPLTDEETSSALYKENISCPYCAHRDQSAKTSPQTAQNL